MRFTRNRSLDRDLARSAGMRAFVQAGAEATAAAAKRRINVTRRYGGARDISTTAARVDRRGAVATVEFDNPFWALDEFGSVNSPAVSPLRGGADDAGLKVRSS